MHILDRQAHILEQELASQLSNAHTLNDVEKIRVSFLGKKGSITALLHEIKNLSLEEKHTIVPRLNELKKKADLTIQGRHTLLQKQELAALAYKKEHFDVTAYKHEPTGHLHPFTHFVEEIENIFLSMGYELFDGPEVETDFYNFEALNIPQDHPARDMYDTLWLNKPGLLMRTHTSPVQVHAMQRGKLPLAGIAIGRVFRHEAVDASHDVLFMQCEGIVIDEKITLAHLFGTAQHFLQTLFKSKELDIRIRPGYFPFVEPGVEIDMRCPFCKKGCSVCKKSTWIEVFPGGLIHPHVLKASGIDPEKYSGFAFGFGLTRLAMLKYGINDIRLFHCGKKKFLQQF